MIIEIKKVTATEIDKVCEILSSVVSHMKEINFTQWDDGYPRRDILEADIARGDLFGAYIDGVLAGFSVINTYQDSEYDAIDWQFGEPYFVIHRLQVDPIFRGKGVAYEIMLFAHELAKNSGAKAMRLDTRQDNIPALKLYKKLSYIKRGVVHFPRMMEYDFICLEKRLL